MYDKQSVSYELSLTDFEHEGVWTSDDIRLKGRETRETNAMNEKSAKISFYVSKWETFR